MQSSAKRTKPKVEEVKKPIITGSWHGEDAWRLALKRALAMLGISLLYLIGGLLLSFSSLWGRVLTSAMLIGLALYYECVQGMSQGQNDAAYGEIMYARRQEGKELTKKDTDRCFHPMKGYFAAMVGALPIVLVTLVFALITKPAVYRLGALPQWTQGLMNQSEFGDALRYYGQNTGMQFMDVLRVIVRACVMPFINVAVLISDSATLLVERLSPLLVLIAPLGYGIGYRRGLKLRARINTGIKMGDARKKRRERRERKARRQNRAPERLI